MLESWRYKEMGLFLTEACNSTIKATNFHKICVFPTFQQAHIVNSCSYLQCYSLNIVLHSGFTLVELQEASLCASDHKAITFKVLPPPPAPVYFSFASQIPTLGLAPTPSLIQDQW